MTAIPNRYLLAFGVVFGLMLVVLPPTFETNDDPVMALLLSGNGLVRQPTNEAIWIHPWLGQLLATLYSRTPNVPWFGGLQIGLIASSFLMVAEVLFDRLSRQKACILSLVFLLGIAAYQVAYLQFTTTASLACNAGLLWLLAECHRTKSRRSVLCFLATVAVIFGAMLRIDSLLLAVTVNLPLWVIAILRDIFGRGHSAPRVVWTQRYRPIALLSAGCCIVFFSQRIHHEGQPEWRDFYARKRIQGEFLDNNKAPWNDATQPIFERHGWSLLDYRMLQSWCFAERDKFSVETMTNILSDIPDAWKRRPVFDSLAAVWQTPKTRQILLLVATIVFMVIAMRSSRLSALSTEITFLLAVVICTSLLMYRKLPDRIVTSIATAIATTSLAAAVLLGSRPEAIESTKRNRIWLLVAGLAIVATLAIERKLFYSPQRLAKLNGLVEDMRDFSMIDCQVVVTWGWRFPFEAISPLSTMREFSNRRWISLGWPFDSPTTADELRELKIDDILTAMYQRKDLVVVCDDQTIALFQEIIARRNVLAIEAHPAFTGKTFSACRFRQASK